MPETDSLALLFGRESVLIPTTVSCLSVKVPGWDERPAVSFNLRKLATLHSSYSRSRSRAGRVGQGNPHNQSDEDDHEKNSGKNESSLLATFHRSRQINCRDSESNFPRYIACINMRPETLSEGLSSSLCTLCPSRLSKSQD